MQEIKNIFDEKQRKNKGKYETGGNLWKKLFLEKSLKGESRVKTL